VLAVTRLLFSDLSLVSFLLFDLFLFSHLGKIMLSDSVYQTFELNSSVHTWYTAILEAGQQ
jgi:hypothetical protein